jgi:hypothetical protein
MDSMQFTVTISPQSGYEVVELQDHMSGAQVQLYSLGALLNAFVIPTKTGTINGIDGYSSINDADFNTASTASIKKNIK